jgi:hypothetical protein
MVGQGGAAMAARRGGGAEEEAVELPARVREGGGKRGCGLVGQRGLLGHSGPKGQVAVGLFGPKVEGKIISE